jgi:hypothetical protein
MRTRQDLAPVSLGADLGFSLQGDDIAVGADVAWSGVRTRRLAAPPPQAVDGLLALLVLGLGLATFGSWARHPALIPVIVALAVPIVFRRQYPTAAFAAAVAVGAVQVVAFRFPAPRMCPFWSFCTPWR